MTPHKPKWSDRQSYQRYYRAHAVILCECTRPATVLKGGQLICARCAGQETKQRFDELHRPTCGIPEREPGLAEHALCLPSNK